MSFLGPLHYDRAKYDEKSRSFRRRRFALFLPLIDHVLDDRARCEILDIGGDPDYWDSVGDLLQQRCCRITLLNRAPYPVDPDKYVSLPGDARDLRQFPDMSFDLVHSNSVIEHVGRWPEMQAMAREVRRLAPNYFVQTPNFWFPIEPHCATPLFHWLPEAIRLSMLMRRPRGHWGRAADVETAMRQIQSVALLDRSMLASLFPDAEIHRERFLGMTKSLIAVRTSPPILRASAP